MSGMRRMKNSKPNWMLVSAILSSILPKQKYTIRAKEEQEKLSRRLDETRKFRESLYERAAEVKRVGGVLDALYKNLASIK